MTVTSAGPALSSPVPFAGRLVHPDEIVDDGRPTPRARRRREIVAVLDPVRPHPTDPTDSVRPPREVVVAAADRLTRHLQPGELVAVTDDGRLRLRLRREDSAARPVRLQEMGYHALEVFESLSVRDREDATRSAGRDSRMMDLGVGWAPVTRRQPPAAAEQHADAAATESLLQRDLQPRGSGTGRRTRQPRIGLWSAGNQLLMATVGSVLVPFLVLVGLHTIGYDVSGPLYWALVAALAITAVTIWAECSRAFDPPRLPPAQDAPVPPASAVIAAYLPNEADTILETLRHFLSLEHPGGLQVVLAYNTPVRLDVEADLRDLAAEHEALTVLEVRDSTSKAQNVNAALRVATGEVVGIFDADHHPMPGAFERAWRWLGDPEQPADVVQGHCVIRNGADSLLARIVAVEFEQIYAVAHPGRAQLHGFGIFGGSNGYWRASALERIRLRGSYLTEDIEASMRVLAAGGRIVNDPGLVSRELAPETPRALWRQRMRWAQGWFQVSVRHLGPILRSPELGPRQKLGATYLLGWREVYPWITVLAWPLFGFLAWRDGGLDLTSPLFALLTVFVTLAGPVQTVAAYRLAAPEIRAHRWWFVVAGLANLLAYTELKNLVNRVAHIKQLRGEHQWVVTPRTASSTGSSDRTDDGEHLDTGTDTDTDLEVAAA